MKQQTINPILIIVIFLLGFFGLNFIKTQLLEYLATQGYESIDVKHAVVIGFNTVYTIISFYLIKRYQLIDLAGLGKKFKFKNWFLLLFPLYLVILNIPYPEDINLEGVTVLNYILLALWSISVGFSEEFMLRGFTQSLLLTKYGRTKKAFIFQSLERL